MIRSEYEYIMPYRVGPLYANMAEENGVVLDITKDLLKVQYASGAKKSILLGVRYGKAEGTPYRHELVTTLKKGSQFKKGSPLSYNKGFFEPDWLNPEVLVFKTQMLCTTAMTETNEVHEDSCSISSSMSKKFSTDVIKIKESVVECNKTIFNMVNIGDEVDVYTPLFILSEDEIDESNLNKDTIDLLKKIGSVSPKAKVKGIIDDIEVLYNADLEDMSPSLRKICMESDKRLKAKNEGTENPYTTGKVSSDYRVKGKNLMLDTLEIKIHIRVPSPAIVGDKGVFASQLKTIIADVFTYDLSTTSGEKVDAMFGMRPTIKRIVNSPFLLGTTNRLLRKLSKKISDAYFG
jgi:hypothetical protein